MSNSDYRLERLIKFGLDIGDSEIPPAISTCGDFVYVRRGARVCVIFHPTSDIKTLQYRYGTQAAVDLVLNPACDTAPLGRAAVVGTLRGTDFIVEVAHASKAALKEFNRRRVVSEPRFTIQFMEDADV